MKVYCLVVLVLLPASIFANDLITSSKVIGPLDSGYPPRASFSFGLIASPDIFFLSIEQGNSDILSIGFLSTLVQSGINAGGGLTYETVSFKSWRLNSQTETAQLINEGDGTPAVNELSKDASSVIVDQRQLVLEKAHISSYPLEDSPTDFHSVFLNRAMESHNQRFIGGALTQTLFDGNRNYNEWHEIALWEKSSGRMIFQTQPEEIRDYFRNELYDCVAIGFSPDDQFFYLRELNHGIVEPIDIDGETLFDDHLMTGIKMINTETFEQFPADKDVAFTNDGRFYVTAVDGVPSLVSTTHGKARQQYNIDGKIMTAAAVSPDDQHIYIATHTDEVYVFPSQLPTSHVEAWEANK